MVSASFGCGGQVKPLGPGEDGVEVGELGAFCVDPAMRGSGRGDSLLDYTGAGVVPLVTAPMAGFLSPLAFSNPSLQPFYQT